MKYTAYIFSIIILFSCDTPRKQQTTEKIDQRAEILISISNLLLSQIDTSILNTYKIDIRYQPCIDTDIISTAKYWLQDSIKFFSKDEKENLNQLFSNNCDSITFDQNKLVFDTIKRIKTQSIDFPTFTLNICKLHPNKSNDEAYSVLGSYFGIDIISGGEEIVVFKKIGTDWKVFKKLMIIEY